MKRKAEMTQDQIDEYEEGDYASDEEDEELMKSCDRLNVFCVSSSEYQKLKDQQITDGSSKVKKLFLPNFIFFFSFLNLYYSVTVSIVDYL